MFRRFFLENFKAAKSKSESEEVEILRKSPLLDPVWYRQAHHDLRGTPFDVARHYLDHGAREGRNPHPLFDTKFYLEQNPDVASSGINPLTHYILHGARECRDPHPLFDTKWYLEKYADVASSHLSPFQHYLTYGAAEGRDPSPLFDTKWYLSQFAEIPLVNPLIHFVDIGVYENLSPNPLFDVDWYLSKNPDVARSGLNPLVHYRITGGFEGRASSLFFDSDWYLTKYQDVARADWVPLAHYLTHGVKEGRLPYDTSSLSKMRIAVVAHCFYDEIWHEVSKALRNIPVNFDLFITVPEDNAKACRLAITRTHPDANILEVNNVGRDIGAFMAVMPAVLERNYSAICKIHTKKGITEPETWRYLLLQGVLGSKKQVANILRAFQSYPDLWLVGAREFYLSGPINIGQNLTEVQKIVRGLFPKGELPEEWNFFAGTMFWVRPEAVARLVPLINDYWEFERYSFVNDGQIAHALERVFGLLPTMAGKRVGLTRIAEVAPVSPFIEVKKAPGIASGTELAHYLRDRAKDLRPHLLISTQEKWAPRRWSPQPGIALGVNVIAPVEYVNGVAVYSRGMIASIAATDAILNVIPWRPGFDRLNVMSVDYPSRDLQPINLVVLNLDLLASGQLLDASPLKDIVSPERYNILTFFWELTAYPQEWIEVIERFDEIWVASSFLARGISAVTKVPVHVMRATLEFHANKGALSRARFGLPDDRFIFFYSADAGSVLGRKNPKALLDAYLKEFSQDEGACCLLKVHYAGRDDPFVKELIAVTERRSDVKFVGEILEESVMHELFGLIDCYVSPHRSEGLGLTILEAMAAKKPIVATAFGGVTDFVTPETAIPVDYRLVEVGAGNEPYPPTFIWADPKEDSLRIAMRAIFADRKKAASIGLAGYGKVHDLFSNKNASREMKKELRRIWEQGASAEIYETV
jgi:glycosyltransferase involved in cell wall biosynthesis